MYVSLILDKKNTKLSLLSRRTTDDPVDAFLLLLPMKMMMVTISTKKMDDNDTEVDNNYDI